MRKAASLLLAAFALLATESLSAQTERGGEKRTSKKTTQELQREIRSTPPWTYEEFYVRTDKVSALGDYIFGPFAQTLEEACKANSEESYTYRDKWLSCEILWCPGKANTAYYCEYDASE